MFIMSHYDNYCTVEIRLSGDNGVGHGIFTSYLPLMLVTQKRDIKYLLTCNFAIGNDCIVTDVRARLARVVLCCARQSSGVLQSTTLRQITPYCYTSLLRLLCQSM